MAQLLGTVAVPQVWSVPVARALVCAFLFSRAPFLEARARAEGDEALCTLQKMTGVQGVCDEGMKPVASPDPQHKVY